MRNYPIEDDPEDAVRRIETALVAIHLDKRAISRLPKLPQSFDRRPAPSSDLAKRVVSAMHRGHG
jgi:hypothetical protein